MLFNKAGLQTSIQDFGRIGNMHLGVSHSGAMDKTSLALANYLVGKAKNSPAIEITLIGPKITFQQSMSIAVCGARFDIYLNNELVFNDEIIRVRGGDVLEFEQLNSGARAYLAFSGSVDFEKQLDSYSTHITAKIGGLTSEQLKDGDQIPISSTETVSNNSLPKSMSVEHVYSGKYVLRCVDSVETKQFSNSFKKHFYSQRFKISMHSNRMGIRLETHEDFTNDFHKEKLLEMTSTGLTQGSIQIPPNGQPIISSVDGQTIGGYPRIANIISADLDMLGQLKSNDMISFKIVGLEQAMTLYQLKQTWLENIIKN